MQSVPSFEECRFPLNTEWAKSRFTVFFFFLTGIVNDVYLLLAHIVCTSKNIKPVILYIELSNIDCVKLHIH